MSGRFGALWLFLALSCAPWLGAAAQTTQEGGGVLPQRDDDQIVKPPMCVQATQLLDDIRSNSLIAQGNVEIYYNNFILTADQVIYDRSANKLIAEGNAQLKDPNGSITRADRFEALDDFRDAFRNAVDELSTLRTLQAYIRKCSEILKTAPPHVIIRGMPPSARFP